jgi:putative ABC transport system permease protein
MWARLRAALGLLALEPWRRAPLLLWRRPGVLATVAGACAVLSASVAAVPLFLSSVGTEAIAVQSAERCPRDTGATYQDDITPSALREPSENPFAPLTAQLGPTESWALAGVSLARPDGSRARTMPVLARDDFLDHVEVVDGGPGPGLWISDRAADITRLTTGDVATVVGGSIPDEGFAGRRYDRPVEGRAELPIVGVYRDLAGSATDDDYWCVHGDLLLAQSGGLDSLPPPVVLVERATLADLMDQLGVDAVPGVWAAPIREGGDLTPRRADELVADMACRPDLAPTLLWCDGVTVAGNGTVARRIEREPLPFEPPGTVVSTREYDDAGAFLAEVLASHLPFVIERTRAIRASVAGGVVPVAGFAGLAGVGLVGAAASLWFDRRRREVTLLTVRGVSPAGLGLKAALELVPALLAGSAAGVGLAYGVMRWLGPSPVLEPAAVLWAAVAGGAALIVAAVVVGVVAALRVRLQPAQRRTWRGLRVVPWEILAGFAAAVSFRRLGEWGVPVARGADVTEVDVLGLLFPLLFLVAAVGIAMRLLMLALPRVQVASRHWPPAPYLAVRRVARYRVAVAGLVAASAVAGGVFAYAATLNRSLAATLDAKARVFVGSDVAVHVPAGLRLPPDVSPAATVVRRYTNAWVDTYDGRDGAIVLALDPATFARGAYWDASFADVSLDELVDRLATPAADGSIPAVVVGPVVPAVTEAAIRSGSTSRFTIEQVTGVDAFPGMQRQTTTIIVAASALDGVTPARPTSEAWIRGDHDDVVAELAAAGFPVKESRKFTTVVDRASFLTVSWTFGFTQSLGVAAGVLTLGGVALYLDARRRGRVLGYAFARRMGLARRTHRRAVLAELAASVVVGCWLGLGVALVGAGMAYRRIDPVPDYRPDPMLRPAVGVIVALALIAVVVAGLAAAWAQRRTDRDDPVEVLRAGV